MTENIKTPLTFKKNLKVYIADRKDILEIKPAPGMGVVCFDQASGVNYTKFEKYAITRDQEGLYDRRHPNNFAAQEDLYNQVRAALEKMSDCTTIVFQCGSAEIRSIAAATAFYLADQSFGGFFMRNNKKLPGFFKVDDVPARYSATLGRFNAMLTDDVAEAQWKD